MIGTTLFAVMGLYVALVAVGCTQLEKIQAALLAIRQQGASEMNARLVDCVVQHQYVLRLAGTPSHVRDVHMRRIFEQPGPPSD
jgi:hypothetical protein